MAKTALHDLHLESGAHMVDFFGWQLPMHYGSQIDEHLKVRNSAGIFDVSHMKVTDIEGKDAEQWLRRLLSCDVTKIKQVGQCKYCLLLNDDGGIVDDLIVYRMPMGFRLVSNCGTRARVEQWLSLQLENAKLKNVQIRHRNDLSIIAAQGPKSFTHVFQVIYTKYEGTKEFGLLHHHFEYAKEMAPFYSRVLGEIHLSRTGYTGEEGVELILPHELAVQMWQDLLDIGVQPCGLGARDTLRLEAGMSLYGVDMTEDDIPREVRLNWALDLNDPARDFIGRNASQEREMRFRTTPFIVQGRGIPRHNQQIFLPQASDACGVVTSGTYSPSLQIGLGFCRIPTKKDLASFEIEIRQKRQPIDLTKGPFLKKGDAAYTVL